MPSPSVVAEPNGIRVVLVHPEIPPNTGNIGRLCAATRTSLHLIEPLGFSLDDRYLKRAGLDYWPHLDLTTHASWSDYQQAAGGRRAFYLSARAEKTYVEVSYQQNDAIDLIFGCETRGLPAEIVEWAKGELYRIPIHHPEVRSLNLSNAVSITLYEALRQRGAL